MSNQATSQIHAFGRFQFDRERGLLLEQGIPVSLRPKAMLLLTTLLEKSGTVVSKGDLMETLWPNVYVGEDSLTQAVRDLRKTISTTALL